MRIDTKKAHQRPPLSQRGVFAPMPPPVRRVHNLASVTRGGALSVLGAAAPTNPTVKQLSVS